MNTVLISSPAAGGGTDATAGISSSMAVGRDRVMVGSSAGGAGSGGGGGGSRGSTRGSLTGAFVGTIASSTQ